MNKDASTLFCIITIFIFGLLAYFTAYFLLRHIFLLNLLQ